MSSKISIIIPIYNVEKYLSACIESVINQTYQNLEIILVNDGCTDFCPKICEKYALKDKRVKVIHQKNAGVAVARNTGLQNISGSFVSFVDADDILAPHFYQNMLQSLLENNADIVECSFAKFENEENLNFEINSEKIIEKVYVTEKALELLIKEEVKQMPCNKLFTTKVSMDILFPPGKKHEDDFWAFQIIGNSKRVVSRNEVLYFYRTHVESNMGRAYNLTRLDGLLAFKERINYMKHNFPKLENLAIKVFCGGSLWHYQKIDKHSELDPQKINRHKILGSVNAYNKISIFKHWKLKEIFWFQFFMMTPNICVKFRNYINVGI